MSEEKKLSKDELDAIEVYEKILRSPNSPARRRNMLGGLLKKHKRLIESSPQAKEEPSIFNKQRRRKVLDWAERWKQNLPFTAYQTLLAILKTTPEIEAKEEPSEAELGEFIEKWDMELRNHKLSDPTHQKQIKQMLKEYDELRRG